MNHFYIEKELEQKALDIVKVAIAENDVEDQWWTLSDDWDLNVWTDYETNEIKATMYPVFDGKTDTSIWHELDIDDLLPCERCHGTGELEDYSDPLYLSIGVTKYISCPNCNNKE